MSPAPSGPELERLRERREALQVRYVQPRDARPTSTARGVHHLALICSDIEQTIRFYQELLGFPLIEVMENRDYPGSTHIFHDLGKGNLLAFFDFPGLGLRPGVESIGSVQHIAISVAPEQLAAARARLDGAGIAYVGPEQGIENSIYVKDPDGIQIELLQEPLLEMEGRPLGE